MRILITGGAGFIGSHLARYCQKQGHTVGIIDRDFSKDKMLDFESKWQVDLTDYSASTNVNMIFNEFKPSVCYHLAAYASEGRSNHIREFITRNNTLSTMRVINYCVKYNIRLIFTSSVAVYSGEHLHSEEETPNPIDEYGLSKYMSECSIKIAAETQGLEYCIVRPRNVYGPGQNMFDPSRNLFGIWMYNALHKKQCLIYGDGTQERSFTYIDDLIPSLYKARWQTKGVINVGSSMSYSINSASSIFMGVTGYGKFAYVEARHEVKEARCSTHLSEVVLGWRRVSLVSLDTGLDRMWTWAQQQVDRPLDVMPPLEVEVNVHSSLK